MQTEQINIVPIISPPSLFPSLSIPIVSNLALSDSRASLELLIIPTFGAFSDRCCLVEHLRRGNVLQLLFASKIEIHVTLIHLAIGVEVLILKAQTHTAPTIFVNHLFFWV